MKRRLRVLVSAYACNPYQGSEKAVGWGWVTSIAKHHDVWAIVGDIHKDDIEREISSTPSDYRNVRFEYVPRARWFKLERIWPPAYLWTYNLWQRAAYRLGVRLHREIGFDLVHLITYVGFRVPGELWKLGIPFVWGPVGGLENTAWRLLPLFGYKGFIYYACRNIMNMIHKAVLSAPKQAFEKANGGIIAATERIRSEIRKCYGYDSHVICEVGPPQIAVEEHSIREPGEPLRISWSGLHLPGKALPLLLNALANECLRVDWQLYVLGHGPCTPQWHDLAEKLGISNRCHWCGWLPRGEAMSVVRQSHVFVITSLKDLTSTVLMEALSLGVPVICPDQCGFADIVTEECGVVFGLGSRRDIESRIVKAIEVLDGDEGRRVTLARGAIKRVQEFSWENKMIALNRIYARKRLSWQ